MSEREQQPYEGEEAEAPGTDDVEEELPGVPGATPADDPSDRS